QCRSGEPGAKQESEPRGKSCPRPQQQRDDIETEKPRPGLRAEGDRRGFDVDPQIVLLVLMRVDRVVSDGPEHTTEIEQDGRPSEGPGDGGPTEQRSPVEI